MKRTTNKRIQGLAIAFTLMLASVLSIWSYRSSAAGEAKLTVSPTTARQNDTVQLVGSGFAPGETVAIWVTYPDFTVFAVAEVATNADGNFATASVPDFLGVTYTPTGKYTYTAFGKSSARQAFAELQVTIAPGATTSQGISIQAVPGKDDQGSYFVVRGSGYGSSESLGVWLRYPDNTLEDLGQITSGPSGSFEFNFRMTGAPVGHYAFTARGLRSGLNGIAEFDLTIGDLTTASGTANLKVSPAANKQRNYALFEGWGYQPGEIASIWVTLPDYSTLAIGDVTINAQGGFVATLYLNEQDPVGKRTYTAFGNASRRKAIADYTLAPGGPQVGIPGGPTTTCDGIGCTP